MENNKLLISEELQLALIAFLVNVGIYMDGPEVMTPERVIQELKQNTALAEQFAMDLTTRAMRDLIERHDK